MNDLFFWASKSVWTLISPDHFLLILLTLAVLLSANSGKNHSEPKKNRGRGLLWSVLLLFWLVALFPFGNLLLSPLEKQFPRSELPAEEALEGVIVLGGAEKLSGSIEWNSLETNAVAERLLVIPALLRRYPKSRFIYTSGSGSIEYPEIRGADLVEKYLKTIGLSERFEFERNSRNTYENAKFSQQLIGRTSGRWLLVTSAFHMPRSVGVFRNQGVDVVPYPVDHWSTGKPFAIRFNLSGNLRSLKMGLREWTGLVAYYFTGKTSEILPSPLQTEEINPNGDL